MTVKRDWTAGYGVIAHTEDTRQRLVQHLSARPPSGDGVETEAVLWALDRVCSAAMWLVVHETYARQVYLDGRPLSREDFKPIPEGHTGGSLNMVPAYAGYLAANALSGHTRGWLMGQGHCVAAIDTLNLLVGNMTPAHAARYDVTDEGLTRYVRDFYSYRLGADGRPDSPLGSHVNGHTAGGMAEGGYLGFAELQYVHAPLPGTRLVTFLSDGAFEEQRGSDWAPRWWRSEDSGLVVPIMIKNGRRIDQRTTMSQQGGEEWLTSHLQLNGFDPVVFDGRDPAAFVWAILELEGRLEAVAQRARAGQASYPVPLPYGIAVAPKGFGFPGAGTNLAHNLPLMGNPATDSAAARMFNEGARRLWVPPDELAEAVALFARHAASGRPRERDHALATPNPAFNELMMPPARVVTDRRGDGELHWTRSSPMQGVDETFVAVLDANPRLRPRVGNPDEMRSNRLLRTLDRLEFRVTAPEPGIPESVHGAVITALNEEAVVSAALANKSGINLVHTYEAFGPKMHGAVRQEVIFARNCAAAGRTPRWLSVPVIMTSHTWENGKNEHSHQDPSFAESMMGEPIPYSRVLFPADFNTAAAVTAGVYRTRGQIWTLVVPKSDVVADLFTPEEATRLLAEGVQRLDWASYAPERARVVLAAVGAYQLCEVLRAARRLAEREVPHLVLYWLEPGRLAPEAEASGLGVGTEATRALVPASAAGSVFLTHTRPHVLWGLLGPRPDVRVRSVLGYRNEGGTLDTPGMLMVNRCTWAHVLVEVAAVLEVPPAALLTQIELDALGGRVGPQGVVIPHPVGREPGR